MTKTFLVGVAVGSGLTARSAAQGQADFLLAINAGRFRAMGAPSVAGMLPIHDATELTDGFAAAEVLNQTNIPVFLGVNVFGAEKSPQAIARYAADQGFQGIVNFPSSMHYPASMQRILERAGRGIAAEVAVLAEGAKLGLQSIFYCANRNQARLGADAKLDMILLNFGWNSGGSMGHEPRESIEEIAVRTRELGRYVKKIHPKVKFLLEGGPIVTADDLSRVAALAEFDGYIGGSTIERLPIESAVSDLISSYRSAGRSRPKRDGADRKVLRWAHGLGAAGTSQEFLNFARRLEKISGSSAHVMIRHEVGADLTWVQQAFETTLQGAGLQIIRPGVEDRFGAAGRLIFGHSGDAPTRPGALGDPSCGLLTIHGPELLSPRSQRRLSRALTEGRFTMPGSRKRLTVQPRCLFFGPMWADGEPPDKLDPFLAKMVGLHVLDLPPLRARSDDIPLIIEQRFDRMDVPEGRRPQFKQAALQFLQGQEWSGNEASLFRVVDQTLLEDRAIDLDHLKRLVLGQDQSATQPDAATERSRIAEALRRNGFHRGKTAAALGISRKTLYNKIMAFRLSG
jgi:predicted TIM-barrel enzyme/DNA-binding NtrC family response regulator